MKKWFTALVLWYGFASPKKQTSEYAEKAMAQMAQAQEEAKVIASYPYRSEIGGADTEQFYRTVL